MLSSVVTLDLFTSSIERSASIQVSQRPILRFFTMQERHVAPIGVKIGVEHLLHAKFHLHRCNGKGTGPPKLKCLLRFDQNVEYRRLQGRIPCVIFTKFSEFVTRFKMR